MNDVHHEEAKMTAKLSVFLPQKKRKYSVYINILFMDVKRELMYT